MITFRKIYILLFFVTVPLFSQSSDREQGLLTREPLWRQALGGTVLSLPSVQAQSAVVALDGGNIRAYSTAGTPMWTYSARGRISPYVTRSREGTSYFSRTNGILIAINRVGRELWRRNLDNPLNAKVVIGWDSRLFVPTERKIYCYTASGNLLWARTLEAPISIAPKLDRCGGVIFALNNDKIYQIDPFGNINEWTPSKTPVVLLSVDHQSIVVLFNDGTMEELGSAGNRHFIQSEVNISLPRLPASPLAAVSRENNIAITMNDGRVSLLSMDERRLLWTSDSHIREIINNRITPETEVEMIYDERGIYVLSINGATGFSHEGRRHWFTLLQNAAAVPAFGNDGVLYSGGKDWILYTYKIEDRVLPERNAIYGPAPEGTYGMGYPHIDYTNNIPLSEQETKAKLDLIAAGVNAGMMGGNEPVWTSFLLNVSAGHYPLQFRITAIGLLGKIGSQETIPWLINIYNRANEPFIKIAAVNAIGGIGVDPQGLAMQTFLHSVMQSTRDDLVLTAIASATGALCRFSGPPLSETGIRILNILSSNNQLPMARRQANREIASLR
ncbi:MAG: PQQ-binding-like beta-propeller repeat protein [Treponema sp.]|nr:PQQ-binding-like beta-propeller repeat protein [Treponema sp.]